MKRNLIKLVSLLAIPVFLLSACSTEPNDKLIASGTFSAIGTSIVSEISGKVTEVNVNEGDNVTVGQVLFVLDAEVSQAQYDQATAAVKAAEAAVEASRKQAESASAQYQLALQGAMLQDLPERENMWGSSVPDNYQPEWYFNENELIDSAKTQVTRAETALEAAMADLENEQKKTSSQDFLAAEKRLALAQGTLTVAETTLKQAQSANDTSLENAAMELRDLAQAEFDSALSGYERMLTSTAAEAIIQTRSRVTIAQTTLDNARYVLLGLQTGSQSLQVLAALKAADAADSMVKQAEAGLEQAKQAQNLAQLQLNRTKVKSPVDGVVLTRGIEIGDMAMAGGAVMRVGQLDNLDLVVYLPEDEYGAVNIGDSVYITVDSFPAKTFEGTILRISDEAEFTPKNVQTESGRKSTVYAVKIQVRNPDHKLKPGMPADVEFSRR